MFKDTQKYIRIWLKIEISSAKHLLFRLLISFFWLLNKDPWVWIFIWVFICLCFCWCLFTSCNIYKYKCFVLQRHWKMFLDMYVWLMQAIMWTMVHSTLYQRRSQRQRENTFVSKRRSSADKFSTFRVDSKKSQFYFFLPPTAWIPVSICLIRNYWHKGFWRCTVGKKSHRSIYW